MRYIKRTDTAELARWARNMTAISLFSGCGGAALGVSQAGFNVRVAVEWDKMACETLRWNFTAAAFKERHERDLASQEVCCQGKVGRVVYRGSLENCLSERARGFKSYTFRIGVYAC